MTLLIALKIMLIAACSDFQFQAHGVCYQDVLRYTET